MRFMALMKGNEATENYVPKAEDAAQMDVHIKQAKKDGWLIATEGLKSSATAATIKVENGRRTVTDGPFAESKELIASYAIIEVASKEEAIERTAAFLDLVGGGEVDVYQLYEEADFA